MPSRSLLVVVMTWMLTLFTSQKHVIAVITTSMSHTVAAGDMFFGPEFGHVSLFGNGSNVMAH